MQTELNTGFNVTELDERTYKRVKDKGHGWLPSDRLEAHLNDYSETIFAKTRAPIAKSFKSTPTGDHVYAVIGRQRNVAIKDIDAETLRAFKIDGRDINALWQETLAIIAQRVNEQVSDRLTNVGKPTTGIRFEGTSGEIGSEIAHKHSALNRELEALQQNEDPLTKVQAIFYLWAKAQKPGIGTDEKLTFFTARRTRDLSRTDVEQLLNEAPSPEHPVSHIDVSTSGLHGPLNRIWSLPALTQG